jgi:hypothetical protein
MTERRGEIVIKGKDDKGERRERERERPRAKNEE